MISKARKIFVVVVILFAGKSYAFGQTNTVYTPKNSPIPVIIDHRGSNSDNIDKDDEYKLLHPEIRLIPTYSIKGKKISTNKSFNCHGYAWHMARENNNDWNQEFNELMFPVGAVRMDQDFDTYWNDESYKEVFEYMHPAVINFGNTDHSAITTQYPDSIISKLGPDGPLAIHAIYDGEYSYQLSDIGSTIHYYIIHDYCDRYYKEFTYTLSDSPQEFTSKPAFTINNLQDYDEVIWEYSSNLIKDEDNSSHNTITFDIDCNSSASIGWVRATVNHAPGNSECENNGIDAGIRYVYTKPEISVEDIIFSNYAESPTYTLCNSHYNNYFHIDNKNNFSLFQVQVCQMNGQVIYEFSTSSTIKSINYPNLNGMYLFRVKGRYYCEYNDVYFYSDWCEYIPIEYTDCSEGGPGGEGGIGDEGPGGLTIGPNPATNEITVKISGKLNLNDELIYHENWNIEIYNLLGVKVSQKNNLRGNEHSISTAGLKNGTYIVIARSDNKILRSKARIEN